MIKAYIGVFKKYPLIILTLGFAYGATIVFTFFGPILTITAGGFAPILSVIAVMSHMLGFFLKPFKLEQRPRFLYILLAVILPLVLLFHLSPYYLQIITTIFYAYMIGRIGCFWTYTANLVIPSHIRGKTISSSLFISFTILYLVNMSLPLLTKGLSLILPAAMSGLSVVFYLRMNQRYKDDIYLYKENKKDIKNTVPFYYIFIFLTVVYIAGGFSYGGIYPSFDPYLHIDRYYNVLFYVIGIVIAGIILDKYGRKIDFVLGVGLLGISFTFFIMPSSVITYFITQTFLQAGWAFVNAFGWSFSWDIGAQSKKDFLFPRGISAMLLGASLGAILAQIIKNSGFEHSSIYGIVTFIPLFIAMMILIFFPETLSIHRKKKIHLYQLEQIEELRVLTPRELEVFCHMINGFNNKSIGKALFISENTVKTHISRIYSKLYINSRRELKAYIDKIII